MTTTLQPNILRHASLLAFTVAVSAQQAPRAIFTTSAGTNMVLVGTPDQNFDGDDDFLVAFDIATGRRIELRSGRNGALIQSIAGGPGFGRSLAVVGNVSPSDPTGRADFAFGDPLANRVYVYGLGIANNFEQLANILPGVAGQTSTPEFGYSVSKGPDLNGDSIAEIVIGMPGFVPGGSTQTGRPHGAIDIYDIGTTTWFAGGFLTGAAAGDRFGSTIELLGDFNGDGKREIAVSAPSAPAISQSNAQSIQVLSINPWFTLATLLPPIESSLTGFSWFGNTISTMDDQPADADTISELIVGRPYQTGTGLCYVYLSGSTGSPFSRTAALSQKQQGVAVRGFRGQADNFLNGYPKGNGSGTGAAAVMRALPGTTVVNVELRPTQSPGPDYGAAVAWVLVGGVALKLVAEPSAGKIYVYS